MLKIYFIAIGAINITKRKYKKIFYSHEKYQKKIFYNHEKRKKDIL